MSEVTQATTEEHETKVRRAVAFKHLEFFQGKKQQTTPAEELMHVTTCQFCNGHFDLLKAQGFVPQTAYQRGIIAVAKALGFSGSA